MMFRKYKTRQNIQFFISILVFFGLVACASSPKLDAEKIRPWSKSLDSEYPQSQAVIARYHKGGYDLYDLAARHTTEFGSDTLNLVQALFDRFHFKVLLIEPIPFSSGESPKWFIDEAKKGRNPKYIIGGESSLSVILADQMQIPFFSGEPDHQDIYRALRKQGYTDADVIAFYTVRQIPQWVREHENKENLLDRKIPVFTMHYCKLFEIAACPALNEIKKWYGDKIGHELTADVSTEEVAPILGGKLFTQKISSDVDFIRDHFTLKIIEKLLREYKQVAVIYGAGHFITLRKSFDAALGMPSFIESKP